MSEYLMGIDVGTTGVKALILDMEGNVIANGYNEYPCSFPKPNYVEQDAELVVQRTFEVCKDTVEKSGLTPEQILAVGFSTQRATVGFLDKNNQLIDGIFYVWQDNRAVSEIEYIKSVMPPDEMYKIEGQPITPTFSFEKLIWLMRNEPEKYAKTRKIVLVPDYILYRFGVEDFYTERTNAGCSGMLDIAKLKWAKEMLNKYGIDTDKLSELVKPGTVVGKINKEISEKTGLAEGTLLCTGSGDNQCAALGVGLVEVGDAVLTIGTSGVLIAGSKKPVFVDDMGLMVNPAATDGLYQLEGIQLGAASSYKWIRDTIGDLEKLLGEQTGVDTYYLMDYHIENSPVGANGIVFMPYLIGSGYPHWNMDAKGLFLGLTFTTKKSDLVRAVMEGITLESKDMYKTMKACGINFDNLMVTGGATNSDAWTQIIADMFNLEVKRLQVTEGTNIGAAILAGIGAGIFKDTKEGVERFVKVKDVITPISENVEKYNEIYQVYKNVYQAFNENKIYQQLSKL